MSPSLPLEQHHNGINGLHNGSNLRPRRCHSFTAHDALSLLSYPSHVVHGMSDVHAHLLPPFTRYLTTIVFTVK